jgi:hypothetical protein
MVEVGDLHKEGTIAGGGKIEPFRDQPTIPTMGYTLTEMEVPYTPGSAGSESGSGAFGASHGRSSEYGISGLGSIQGMSSPRRDTGSGGAKRASDQSAVSRTRSSYFSAEESRRSHSPEVVVHRDGGSMRDEEEREGERERIELPPVYEDVPSPRRDA